MIDLFRGGIVAELLENEAFKLEFVEEDTDNGEEGVDLVVLESKRLLEGVEEEPFQ